ncbi:hypothetical protein M758_UG097000 [Ceratodon purpureus]|nr:hypothetical protein M758_UG097000 [Ceratodon purpureus]
MSPDPEFPQGCGLIDSNSNDEDSAGLNETSQRGDAPHLEILLQPLTKKHNTTSEGAPEVPAEDDVAVEEDIPEAYGNIIDKMERRAAIDGFESLTTVRKLAYLKERELEFKEITRKRMAEDDTRAQWIVGKRWRTHYPESRRPGAHMAESYSPPMEHNSTYITVYNPKDVDGADYDEVKSVAAHLRNHGELIREVIGSAVQMSDDNMGIGGSTRALGHEIHLSPLRFKNLSLNLPEGVGGDPSTGTKGPNLATVYTPPRIYLPDSNTD